MSLNEIVLRTLVAPSPEDLWQLQPHLLALGTPQAQVAHTVAGQFYTYLSTVRSKLTSKEFSSLAAKLAAGAVGAFSAQELIDALRTDRDNALRHLLVGGIAETLEVMSTLQNVKAWETEFAFMHEEMVWHLYGLWWLLSVETQPQMSTTQRHVLIESLINPVRNPKTSETARVAMVFRLFQVLLLVRLAPLLSGQPLVSAEVGDVL